jgi:hypothetical protein
MAEQFDFAASTETPTQHWRSIVLFGRNVASYKFALAKSLIELGSAGRDLISLEDLAIPFARNICEHLTLVDRQGTFEHSKFLDACRYFNAGRINEDELQTATVNLGFNNVIDAFHVVGSGAVPTRFFVDERRSSVAGIRLTDEFFRIASASEYTSLKHEVESRWRLVEEAWDAKADGKQVIVLYDAPRELLVPAVTGKRKSITEVRPALNGYQKGNCFYCFKRILVVNGAGEHGADVDHFLPHSLMSRGFPIDLDGVWNLVLACTTCNRGDAGKFASLPDDLFLPRLHRRNEYLINSHHPLRETLIQRMGSNEETRASFLRAQVEVAKTLSKTRAEWKPREVFPATF